MDLYINHAEDFGVAFNMAIRMYMRNKEERLLTLLIGVKDRYISYFSIRTLSCAIRDLQPCTEIFGDPIPNDQKECYENLLKELVRYYINLNRLNINHDYYIKDFGIQHNLLPGLYEDTKFKTFEELRKWIIDNELEEKVSFDKTEYERLPISEDFLDQLDELCVELIKYSDGRLSYMPSLAEGFIIANLSLLSKDIIKKILEMVEHSLTYDSFFKERLRNASK